MRSSVKSHLPASECMGADGGAGQSKALSFRLSVAPETETYVSETVCWPRLRSGKQETEKNGRSAKAAKRATANGPDGRDSHPNDDAHYNIIVCYTMICYSVSHHTILYHIVAGYITLYPTMLYITKDDAQPEEEPDLPEFVARGEAVRIPARSRVDKHT